MLYTILFLALTNFSVSICFKAPCAQVCPATPLGVLATGTQTSVVSNDLGRTGVSENGAKSYGIPPFIAIPIGT